MAIDLSLRDRLSLIGRAIAGSISVDPESVGGRLLAGVIQAGGQAPSRGTREYLTAYSTMPWLRAVASRVSFDIASTEWRLLVETRDGRAVRNRMLQRASGNRRKMLIKQSMDAGEVQEIHDHPALDVLDKANSVQTGLQMRRVTQLHFDLVGEAFWLLERGPLDEVVGIWPVPPNWIVATPTMRRPSYRIQYRAWREEIPESEIIWFSDVDPLNPYGRGTGTAQALADELETDEYASKHLKAFFYNRARPDLIISPKGGGTLASENVERLEEQWTARNQGFWRAFRPFFLQREVEVKELEQNFRTQQMVQLREYERDTILQVFGVSPETLGIVSSGANRATITMGDQIYSKRVLLPRLEMLRVVMQERLLPMFDERLVLDYESPVARDRELELQAGKAAPYALSVNEWREMQGYDALPDETGNVHLVDNKLSPFRFDSPETTPAPSNDDDDDPDSDPDGRSIGALIKARDRESASLFRKLLESSDEDAPRVTQEADKLVVEYRRMQLREWDAVAEQIDIDALAEAIVRDDETSLYDALGGEALTASFTEPILSIGKRMFLRGASIAYADLPHADAFVPQRKDPLPLSFSLDEINPEAVRWADREAARMVSGLRASILASIRGLVVDSQSGQLTPYELAREIRSLRGFALTPRQATAVANFGARLVREAFEAAPAGRTALTAAERARISRRVARYSEAQRRLRALTIARTETIAAANAGQQELWQLAKRRGSLSQDTERLWIVTLDDALDQQICEPLTDARAKLDEPFYPGGFMHPPAHPNCRCAIGIASGARQMTDAQIIGRPSSDYSPMNAGGIDTFQRYGRENGTFTEQRAQLHGAIIRTILSRGPAVSNPQSFVMGGGPAAGKSTMRRAISGLPDDVVTVDADDIRTMLPEFNERAAVRDPDAAAFTHEEASHISKRAAARLVEENRHVLLDGTGDSSIDNLTRKVERLRLGGRTVRGFYATTDVEEAMRRMIARGDRTGRYVPEKYLRSTHRAIAQVFPKAVQRGLFDDVALYDTTTSPPVLIATAEGTKLTIHNDELWQRFLERGK